MCFVFGTSTAVPADFELFFSPGVTDFVFIFFSPAGAADFLFEPAFFGVTDNTPGVVVTVVISDALGVVVFWW